MKRSWSSGYDCRIGPCSILGERTSSGRLFSQAPLQGMCVFGPSSYKADGLCCKLRLLPPASHNLLRLSLKTEPMLGGRLRQACVCVGVGMFAC